MVRFRGWVWDGPLRLLFSKNQAFLFNSNCTNYRNSAKHKIVAMPCVDVIFKSIETVFVFLEECILRLLIKDFECKIQNSRLFLQHNTNNVWSIKAHTNAVLVWRGWEWFNLLIFNVPYKSMFFSPDGPTHTQKRRFSEEIKSYWFGNSL